MKNAVKKDLSYLAVLYVCFLILMLLTSCFTSPLFPHRLGQDSSIFTLLGKGLLSGKELYTDLFDHKGPMIFFIDALGLLIGGRNGIFFLQCVLGLLSLTFLYFTGKAVHPRQEFTSFWQCLLLFVAACAFFFNVFEQGNKTEEYSVPAIAICLFLFVRYAAQAESKSAHPPVYSIVYGLGLAYIAFMRLNNAVTICAGVLAIAIYLLYKKEYGNLLANILCGCVGLLLVTVPILMYFHAHKSLDEMIYATFLHNFTIIGNTGRLPLTGLTPDVAAAYLPVVLCIIVQIASIKESKKCTFADVLLGTILFFNAVVLYVANRYPHYFAIFFPVYLVFLCRYCHIAKKKAFLYGIILCTAVHLLLIAYHCGGSFYRVYIEKASGTRHSEVQSSFSLIPEEERDSVIGYNIQASDYISGDVLPCYKYYTLQNTWAITNPQILEDFMSWVSSNHPLWVLTLPGETHPDLLQILQTDYDYRFENPYLVFYRLKEALEDP